MNTLLTIRIPARMGESFPKWQEGDGPTPYVWENQKPGNKCAWSCVWATRQGQVYPQDWLPVERMTMEQVLAELLDAQVFLSHDHNRSLQIRRALAQLESSAQILPSAISLLQEARVSYPEFTYLADPPETFFRIRPRPGWE